MNDLPDDLPAGSEYIDHRDTLRMPFSPGEDDLPLLIVLGVAAVSGNDAAGLAQLSTAIKPEPLDNLFPAASPDAPEQLRVEFTYEGYRITVFGDGVLEIQEPA